MANHASAAKRARQTEVREARNRARRSRVKSAIRSFRESIEANDKTAAQTQLMVAITELQKAGSKGVYHKGKVSRGVSRLTKAFNKIAG